MLPQSPLRRPPAFNTAGILALVEAPFFHEFVLECPAPVAEINAELLDYDIIGGYDLGQDYPELANHMLVAVTEMNSKDDIDMLVEVLQEMSND